MAELTKEQLVELGNIRKDFFCFLKYVKIKEPGELALDYQLWPHLVDFYEQILQYRLIDLVKAKQIGISWFLAAYALWRIFILPGWEVLMLSQGKPYAQDLLAKSVIIYHNLPKWMQIFTIDPQSTERWGFKEMGSKIISFPSTETAGLGHTAGDVIHDESDFHEFYEVNLGHTRATVVDSPKRRLISVSTVDKTRPDSYFKGHCKMGEGSGYPEAGTNGFKTLFYGVFSRPSRDQVFYDALVREYAATPWVVEANYPRTLKEALSPQSALSCFKKDVLDKLWENSVDPIEVRQGFIYIFSKARVGVKYVAGVDVGEGVGLDYDCLSIVGKDGLKSEVAALIYTNTLATDLFAYEVDKLCDEYYDPRLAVENNSIGNSVLNKLSELGRKNMYSSEVNRKKKAGGKIIGIEKLGWTTGDANKYTAIVELVNDINNGSLITRFKPQIKEMMEYQWVVINGKNKPTATGATHGDTVISLMLAHQMLKNVGNVIKASMYVGGVQKW